MLRRRVIACLDVRGERVVKGVGFGDLRDVGDPVELAVRHEAEGADEIAFLDISATLEGRATFLEVVRRTAERLFVPLTVGGGIRSAEDGARALRAGADKVSLNSAAVARPETLDELAGRFGSQCVVASIDARLEHGAWRVWTHGGSRPSGLDAIEWARVCEWHGAGEVLLTSIDRDGTRSGYDLELTRAAVDAVRVPVVASGGAGSAAHVVEVLARAGADAALLAGTLHAGALGLGEIKQAMAQAGLPVRRAPGTPAPDAEAPCSN
ncbi:MAG TPA: imidazole glycerol phosphate synthase subunit HisF [Candidatus Acidoferrales bacterium]|nr:imidazole glycerol phosphate synthase subunit HisF [Candidatus Acidoferrales bacterium]